jgi:hypothetical protein
MKKFTKTLLIILLVATCSLILTGPAMYLIEVASELLYRVLLAPMEAFILITFAVTFLGIYLEFRE